MKPLYKSKTVWFGALFIANSLAMAFGFGDFVPAGELSEATSMAVGLIVVLLRFVTHERVR